MRRRLFLTAALSLAACSHRKDDDGTTPLEGRTLPLLTFTDSTPDLMLTWIDDKGDTHVELKPADVPPQGRTMVRVVVSNREDGSGALFYVVDLTRKRDDGSYTAQTMRRSAWEAEIEKRRDAYLAKLAPPPPPAGSAGAGQQPGQSAGAPLVIIYGASWCGPCHQAADYLKSKGVRFVMKDVEETPGAAAEMRQKLERAGRRYEGTIPVIDVKGQMLMGFSPESLDRALARAGAGTSL